MLKSMRVHKRSVWALLLVVSAAWAASEYSDYLSALCTRESGCNPSSINDSGYIGNFQMGEAALIDAGYYIKDGTKNNDWKGQWTGKNGINELADFYASPAKQTQAINDYNAKQWGYIKANGSDQYLGKTINGILMTESGLLAGAHLVGAGGLHKFLASGGTVVPKDGNQVTVTNYIAKFNGYNIAPISGNVTPGGQSGTAAINTGNTGADAEYLALTNNQAVTGTGTLSTGTSTAIGTGGSPTVYTGSTATGVSFGTSIAPSAAFEAGASVSYSNLNLAIKSIIAVILFLFGAHFSIGQFKLWSVKSISVHTLQSNMVRVSVLMMFLIFIVVT